MTEFKRYRKLRGGYWIKFYWGWSRADKKIYDIYYSDRKVSGMLDTIEDWTK